MNTNKNVYISLFTILLLVLAIFLPLANGSYLEDKQKTEYALELPQGDRGDSGKQ